MRAGFASPYINISTHPESGETTANYIEKCSIKAGYDISDTDHPLSICHISRIWIDCMQNKQQVFKHKLCFLNGSKERERSSRLVSRDLQWEKRNEREGEEHLEKHGV